MNIVLREVKLEDGKYIVSWRNMKNVLEHCADSSLITEESNELFFQNYIKTGKYKQFMVEKSLEEYPVSYPIATVYLKDLDYKNRKCELGIYPNSDEEWNDKAKIIAIKLLLEKAYRDYGMKKIYSFVIADCTDEIDLLEKAGFKREGYFEDELCGEKARRDLIRMGIVL